MDGNEINKIAGAILGMVTLAMGIGFLSSGLVHQQPLKKGQKAGYELPDASAGESAGGAAPAAVAAAPIAERLAAASVAKGETASKKCVSCHQFNEGGRNGQGPLLWDIVYRQKGGAAGFNYSNALKDRAGKGEKWDYEALDAFLANPRGYMPGTSMAYAGIGRPDERADLIAYLRTLSKNPK